MGEVRVNEVIIGPGHPLTVIAGPCVIENETMILRTAEFLARTVRDLPVQWIFKSSYKKANRTSLRGFTGIDFAAALEILEKVGREFHVPVLTDVHTELEAPVVAEVVDVLQIPAFLCRQTDLLLAAGRTGKAVNIKKGQFLAPEDMHKAAEKVASTGNRRILLTERGTCFGYRNLVVDMRSLPIMAKSGYPVVYDATHSVQIPGGQGDASGGQPEFILPLARAALATGAVNAVFMEVHPDPPNALSDARSQLPLSEVPEVLRHLVEVYQTIRSLST
ncbi:MAG: 3-deoxy-8-phosphooctulonate synthase [Calditrichaeota bacterium]|nr:MAG: 3-deoxy-8-phosphooctulonate synthase [Calditrichota bacterium]